MVPASGARVAERARVERPIAGQPRRDAARDGEPPSFAQQQIWLHAQLAPDVPLYNEPVTIRYRGALEPAALARALSDLVARHEAWRTVFPTQDGRPVQRVLPSSVVDVPFADLRGLPAAEREAEAVRRATEDARRPFDVARGPLLRARLARLADDDSRLYLTLHHAIFDGYSLYQVVVPELAALYAAALAGARAALPELPLQYADWAAWQRAEVERGAYAGQLEYWAKRLADVPVVELPGDRPRPPALSYRGAMHPFALPAALGPALAALSARRRVTLYMTLFAAYLVLVHRYTGKDDLVVGSVSAGRKRPEVGRLLGFFANPLALRVDCSGDPTFVELLQRVRDVALEALSNDDLPFEHVVAALQPERDAARHPFFQTVMSLEAPMARLPEGWDLSHLDVDTRTTKFDLYLEMNARPDGLGGRFTYATDLWRADTIARMAGHYANLLAAVAADPARPLSALPMLDDAERRRVLVDWARARDAYPDPATVHGVFEAQAARTPDAVALTDDATRLTYAEVDARASALARRLAALGVGRDVSVGVHSERSPAMVTALLGVLKAGGAYLPLDPAHPADRLALMAEDAGCRVLVADRNAPRVDFRGVVHTVWLDEVEAGARAPGAAVDPDALAYVMYTSGSTGRPKGVAVPHRAILRLVFGQSYVRFAEDETFLHLSAIAFDAATFDVWGALLHGGRCAVLTGGVPTPRAVREAVRAHGVTAMFLTAAFFNALIDDAPDALAGVRQIVVGGEALSVAHVARGQALLPGARFVNGYGPTEATTFSVCHVVPRPLEPDTVSIPIGRPIAGTETYLLDRHHEPVPVGVPGELHIGGAGLARGYLNRPDLTAERFVAHPFDATPGARLYRTGDLARWRPDGTIEYVGRLDTQVKVRGVRVEPGEVEAVLATHPAVREVAVIAAVGDRPNDVRLIAYVVPAAGEVPTPAALRDFVKRRLPAAFVPAAFVTLETLPLGPTGKLDRRALPAPEPARDGRALVRARGPLQWQLAEVWRELLGVTEVGATDDFFDLGGHSLLAVRMLQRVHDLYGTSLPLAVLYTSPTIEALSEALLASEPAEFQAPLVRLRAGGARPPLFFFHGDLNGAGFYTLTLARHLGADRAFWVIHPLGLHGRPVPTTIEAMARAHVEQVVAAHPEGPLVLGGYCNGGLVAYETARLLTAAGRQVERLVLIATDADTRFHVLRRPIAAAARALGLGPEGALEQFGRVRLFADRLRGLDARGRAAFVTRATARLSRQLARRLRRTLPLPAPAAPPAPPLFERYYDACLGYLPGPWPGHVVVFWPEAEEPARAGDPTFGWGSLVARVETVRVPGDHDEIVTRHIERVATALEARLE
ncbi:MAG TPA: amino acid adenylation domain-containing protein [Methylomirabilota bacterium]|nr:amino acid adenylation domain-containing protein [Methylomirabilota bacterium]